MGINDFRRWLEDDDEDEKEKSSSNSISTEQSTESQEGGTFESFNAWLNTAEEDTSYQEKMEESTKPTEEVVKPEEEKVGFFKKVGNFVKDITLGKRKEGDKRTDWERFQEEFIGFESKGGKVNREELQQYYDNLKTGQEKIDTLQEVQDLAKLRAYEILKEKVDTLSEELGTNASVPQIIGKDYERVKGTQEYIALKKLEAELGMTYISKGILPEFLKNIDMGFAKGNAFNEEGTTIATPTFNTSTLKKGAEATGKLEKEGWDSLSESEQSYALIDFVNKLEQQKEIDKSLMDKIFGLQGTSLGWGSAMATSAVLSGGGVPDPTSVSTGLLKTLEVAGVQAVRAMNLAPHYTSEIDKKYLDLTTPEYAYFVDKTGDIILEKLQDARYSEEEQGFGIVSEDNKAMQMAKLSNFLEVYSESWGQVLGTGGEEFMNSLIKTKVFGSFANWMRKTGKLAQGTLYGLLKQAKFDGVVGEFLEEELLNPLQSAIERTEYQGIDTKEGRERMLIEILGFGATQSGAMIQGYVQNKDKQKSIDYINNNKEKFGLAEDKALDKEGNLYDVDSGEIIVPKEEVMKEPESVFGGVEIDKEEEMLKADIAQAEQGLEAEPVREVKIEDGEVKTDYSEDAQVQEVLRDISLVLDSTPRKKVVSKVEGSESMGYDTDDYIYGVEGMAMPEFIPEELRSRKIVEKAYDAFLNNTVPQEGTKAWQVYQAILDESTGREGLEIQKPEVTSDKIQDTINVEGLSEERQLEIAKDVWSKSSGSDAFVSANDRIKNAKSFDEVIKIIKEVSGNNYDATISSYGIALDTRFSILRRNEQKIKREGKFALKVEKLRKDAPAYITDLKVSDEAVNVAFDISTGAMIPMTDIPADLRTEVQKVLDAINGEMDKRIAEDTVLQREMEGGFTREELAGYLVMDVLEDRAYEEEMKNMKPVEEDKITDADLPFRQRQLKILEDKFLDNLSIERMKEFSREWFGDENVELVKNILRNKKALGMYLNRLIEIKNGQAHMGSTFYHEAVHKAFDIFLTADEKKAMIKEVIRRVGKQELLRQFNTKSTEEKMRLFSYEDTALEKYSSGLEVVNRGWVGVQNISPRDTELNKESVNYLIDLSNSVDVNADQLFSSVVQEQNLDTGEIKYYLVEGEDNAVHAVNLIDQGMGHGDQLGNLNYWVSAIDKKLIKVLQNPYVIVEKFNPRTLPYSYDVTKASQEREYRIKFGITKNGKGKYRGEITDSLSVEASAQEWLAENVIDYINNRNSTTFWGKLKRMVDIFVDRMFRGIDHIKDIEDFYESLISGRLLDRQQKIEVKRARGYMDYTDAIKSDTYSLKYRLMSISDEVAKIVSSFKSLKDFKKDFMVLYHGGQAEIIGEKLVTGGKVAGTITAETLGKGQDMGGIFFTSEKDFASIFTRWSEAGAGKVHNFLVETKNMFDVRNPEHYQMLKDFVGRKYKDVDGEELVFTEQLLNFMVNDGIMDWATFDIGVIQSLGFNGVVVTENSDYDGKSLMTYVLFDGGKDSRHWLLPDEIDNIADLYKYKSILNGEFDERKYRSGELIDYGRVANSIYPQNYPNIFLRIASKFDNAQDFIDHFRGSSTQYGMYTPQLRKFGVTETSARISDLGIDPELKITVYRGIDDSEGNIKNPNIKDGDFVTTDYDSANSYSGTNVVSKEVKAKDLIIEFEGDFDINDPFFVGAEFIYSKSSNKLVKYTDEQLKEMFNIAKEMKNVRSVEEWEKEKKYILKNGTMPDSADVEGFKGSKYYGIYGTSESEQKSAYYDYISEKIEKLNGKAMYRIEKEISVKLPELITMATELGANIKLQSKFRKSGKLGDFTAGEDTDSRIRILRTLFEPQGEEVMDGEGNVEKLPETPEQQMDRIHGIEKVLAHEIGHLFDWFGGENNMTLKRGNILGRIANLRSYTEGQFMDLENKEVRKELKTLTQVWNPFDEATAPKKYKSYRYSAKELYAEAISVFLNKPSLVKEVAPNFYQGFIEYMARKKEVQSEYFAIRDMIKEGNEVQSRVENMKKAQEIARGKRMTIDEEKEAYRKQSKWQEGITAIKMGFVNQYAPYLDKLRRAWKDKKITLSKVEEAEQLMGDLALKGNDAVKYAQDVQNEFFVPVSEAGIDIDTVGQILVLERNLGDRLDLANPHGLVYDYAKETYDYVKGQLTPAQWNLLSEKLSWWRDYNFELVRKGYEAGVYSEQFFNEIATVNKNTYTPFAVVDYIEDNYVTAGVIQATGTTKGVENPLTTQMLKSLSLMKLTATNGAKQDVVNSLAEIFPDEIVKAEAIKDGEGRTIGFKKNPKLERSGYAQLELLEDGKRTAYYMDKYIIAMFDNSLNGWFWDTMRFVTTPLRMVNRIFKPAVTVMKASFQFYSNPLKDYQRSLTNLTALSGLFDKSNVASRTAKVFGAFTKEWVKNLKRSWNYAGGEIDAVTQKMLDMYVLSSNVKYEDIDIGNEKFKFDPVKNRIVYKGGVNWLETLRDWGSTIPVIKHTLVPVYDFYMRAGSTFEVNSKIAGFQYLSEKVGDEKASFYTRRYVGTPDYMQKGKLTPLTNELVVFSNVGIQAITADIDLATRPKTASGYWVSTMFKIVFPKLLMLLGASMLRVPIPDPDDPDKKKWVNPYDYLSEYYKAMYMAFPIGYDEDSESFLFVKAPSDEVGAVIGNLVWKMATYLQGEGMKIEQLGSAIAGLVPFTTGDNPLLSIMRDWKQYLQGRNPYDDFRGRLAINTSKWNEGGMTRFTEMLKWTTNELGVTNFSTYDSSSDTTLEKTMNLPLLERMFELTNYGLQEREENDKALGKKEKNKTLDGYIESYFAEPSNKKLLDLQEQYVIAVKGERPEGGWSGTEKAEETRLKSEFKREILANSGNAVYKSIAKAGLDNDEKLEIINKQKKRMSDEEFKDFMAQVVRYEVVKGEMFAEYAMDKNLSQDLVYKVVKESIPVLSQDSNNDLLIELRKRDAMDNDTLRRLFKDGLITQAGFQKYIAITQASYERMVKKRMMTIKQSYFN